jgi:hypothetical protein
MHFLGVLATLSFLCFTKALNLPIPQSDPEASVPITRAAANCAEPFKRLDAASRSLQELFSLCLASYFFPESLVAEARPGWFDIEEYSEPTSQAFEDFTNSVKNEVETSLGASGNGQYCPGVMNVCGFTT